MQGPDNVTEVHIRAGQASILPWHIPAGDEIEKDCMLVAVLDGAEIQTISLHVATPPRCED